jgi:isoamylase
LYAYRVHGPYEPQNGCRFNANKLLLDPYAKAIAGQVEWDKALYGYEQGNEAEDLSFSKENSARYMPKCIVTDPGFDWEGDVRPGTPFHKTIIYETHVKGFSQLNTLLPENIRGTYAALGHPETIKYLKELGITAIELMPVHYFLDDQHLAEKGLTNYWGYNTIGFFAPEVRYAGSETEEQIKEFKTMVKGDTGCSVQPYCGRQPDGADPIIQGNR